MRFGLWFGDSVRLGLSGKGDAIEVRVPDTFFREWIQSHYTTSLLEAAEAVLGKPMQLSIRIHSELEPPLGDVVEPAPLTPEPDQSVSPGHCHNPATCQPWCPLHSSFNARPTRSGTTTLYGPAATSKAYADAYWQKPNATGILEPSGAPA